MSPLLDNKSWRRTHTALGILGFSCTRLLRRGDEQAALDMVSLRNAAEVQTLVPTEFKGGFQHQFVGRGVTLPIIRVSIMPYKEHERKAAFLRAVESLKGWQPN